DVTRLQALVDKKRIVITEEVIREILQLNDAEGVICLPNDEIFAGLARMGYEKPLVRNVDSSSKFYMYPRFIQLIIQAQVVDLSSHTTRYISPALTQKVFANMRRAGKGFSGVETHLFENMLEVREVDAEEEVQVPAHNDVDQENVTEEIADDVAQPTSPLPPSPVIPSSPPHQSPRPSPSQAAEGSSLLVQQVLDKCSVFVLRVEGLETANTAHQLEILKLKARVKKLERLNKERINVDIDEGIELVVDQEKDAEIEGRQADTQAKIYNIDLDHSSKVVASSTPIPAAKPTVVAVSTPISAVKPAAKPKVLKIVPAAPTVSTRKRKGVVIREPKKELHDDTPAETLSVKDKGKGILVEDPKPMKKKDQIEMDAEYARKLQEEEESHVQTKDVQAKDVQAKDVQAKGIQEEIEKEEDEIIKSISETPVQKASKRRRLRKQAKEAEDLKKQLEVVVDEDDD
nr:hypothetical protein [Tanacetum cinerariifolium]